jgi:hypothetical protein
MMNANDFAVAVHRHGRGAPSLHSGNCKSMEADVDVWRYVNFRSHLGVLGSFSGVTTFIFRDGAYVEF